MKQFYLFLAPSGVMKILDKVTPPLKENATAIYNIVNRYDHFVKPISFEAYRSVDIAFSINLFQYSISVLRNKKNILFKVKSLSDSLSDLKNSSVFTHIDRNIELSTCSVVLDAVREIWINWNPDFGLNDDEIVTYKLTAIDAILRTVFSEITCYLSDDCRITSDPPVRLRERGKRLDKTQDQQIKEINDQLSKGNFAVLNYFPSREVIEELRKNSYEIKFSCVDDNEFSQRTLIIG